LKFCLIDFSRYIYLTFFGGFRGFWNIFFTICLQCFVCRISTTWHLNQATIKVLERLPVIIFAIIFRCRIMSCTAIGDSQVHLIITKLQHNWIIIIFDGIIISFVYLIRNFGNLYQKILHIITQWLGRTLVRKSINLPTISKWKQYNIIQ
jgi:hypothetical protein